MTAADVNKVPSEKLLEQELREHFSLISKIMSFRREKSLNIEEFSALVNLEESKIKALESGDYLPNSFELSSIKRALT